jgi:hypothetical protein
MIHAHRRIAFGDRVLFRCATLTEWPFRMVQLACDLCPRRGQYRKETLVARFGGDVLMPDVLHLVAQCPRKDGQARLGGLFCGFA